MAEKTIKDQAMEIAQLLEDGKADDVTVIDVAALNSWTDYFVIGTVHSSTHYQGLGKAIKDYVKENDMQIHLTHTKVSGGEDWNLVDIGPVVVHLMSKDARDFYELEKLWHAGNFLKGSKA